MDTLWSSYSMLNMRYVKGEGLTESERESEEKAKLASCSTIIAVRILNTGELMTR